MGGKEHFLENRNIANWWKHYVCIFYLLITKTSFYANTKTNSQILVKTYHLVALKSIIQPINKVHVLHRSMEIIWEKKGFRPEVLKCHKEDRLALYGLVFPIAFQYETVSMKSSPLPNVHKSLQTHTSRKRMYSIQFCTEIANCCNGRNSC